MRRGPPSSTLFPSTTLFFFNDPATPEIYPLSLHDALPIFGWALVAQGSYAEARRAFDLGGRLSLDRKSTRLNSSHTIISYAVFCLKKKKKKQQKHENTHTRNIRSDN